MKNLEAIPIVVGVSGHRAIDERDCAALRAAVKEQLEALRERCPHSPLVMFSSLAAGGDLLCADAAEEQGIPLCAVLPLEREDYEKDFTPEARERFAHHLARAERVFTAPATESVPPEPDRDFRYRQAGIYISAHSHVLLALWDGAGSEPPHCGTAAAVDFSLRGAYSPPEGLPLRSDSNEAVIHIFTPRGAQRGEAAGTVHILGNREALRDTLEKTDEFNRLAAETDTGGRRLLPDDAARGGAAERMERLYLIADALSSRYAALYRRILAYLAAASTVLTLAFLLYDEAEAIWMILVCGAMLLAAYLAQRAARRTACHRRYIDYRVLAECLRVQAFLRYAGSGIETAELMTWTQQEETGWIMDALCALSADREESAARDIRRCWVEDQRDYHARAEKKAGHSAELSEKIVRSALGVSITLYFAALLFELLCGGSLLPAALYIGDPESYRTALKIILGGISASTLFIANYYGKLSLPRILSDHGKMRRFYEKMSAQLLLRGQTEELLRTLAREELIENGDWCSYQRDNTPDLSF